MDDSAALKAWVDQRLLYKLAYFTEHELLYGVGGSGKLLGLVPQATAASGSPVNLLDGTAAAIGQLASVDVEASAVICNSADFWQMRAQKAVTSGVYLSGDPLSSSPPALWGVPCIPTPSMTAGQFLVGDFQGSCAVFDRVAATITLSLEHADYFTRNLVAVLCEERLTLGVFRPSAFVVGTVHAGS
jgi:HK97 family phage major capsid protein